MTENGENKYSETKIVLSLFCFVHLSCYSLFYIQEGDEVKTDIINFKLNIRVEIIIIILTADDDSFSRRPLQN